MASTHETILENREPHPLSYDDSFIITVPEAGQVQLVGVALATLLALAHQRRRQS